MNIQKIGNYIKELRCKNNLTQEELANKIYVTNKAVSRWESGKNIPGIDTLYLLSKELNVSVNDILNAGTNDTKDVKKYYDKTKIKKNIIEIILFLILISIPFIQVKINAEYIKAGFNLFETNLLDVNGLKNYINILMGTVDYSLLFKLGLIFLVFVFIKINKKWLLSIPFIISLIFATSSFSALFNFDFSHLFANDVNAFFCIFCFLIMMISLVSFIIIKKNEEK